jgi:hypothetical protein
LLIGAYPSAIFHHKPEVMKKKNGDVAGRSENDRLSKGLQNRRRREKRIVKMATWPSGKARVCKTLITGSNPVVASSCNRPKDESLPFGVVFYWGWFS